MATNTTMTAAEFLLTGPETDGCELIRGEVVPMPPPAPQHGYVAANAVYLAKSYVKRVGHGSVMCNDSGIITQHEPDTVRGADVMLFLHPSWEGRPVPAGYADEPADLVIEVRSPKQSWTKVLGKVSEYLMMGVRLVWVIDPQRRRVTTFGQDQEPTTHAAENELDGGAILPGFRCRVAEFFE